MRKIILNLVLIITLSSCHPSSEEVAGRYYAKHNKGTEYIEFFKNGTFVQYFKNDITEQTNKGTWSFDYKKGQWKLELEDFITYALPYEDYFGSIGRKSYASIYWEKDRIVIYDNGDDEYNYHRKE